MKPTTEKHPDDGMQFFTPELYLRFNSKDDDEADHANADWEKAIERYRAHLTQFSRQLPTNAKHLAESSFHDAEWLDADSRPEWLPVYSLTPLFSAFVIVVLRRDQDGTTLVYQLWDDPRTIPPRADWQSGKQRVHWLFDEIDIASSHQEQPRFWHRILLSDGRTFVVPFVNVLIKSFPLHVAEAG